MHAHAANPATTHQRCRVAPPLVWSCQRADRRWRWVAQVRFEDCHSQLFAGAFCSFDVSGGASASFLVYARLERVSFKGCSAESGDGGALYSVASALEMKQVSFEACTASARHPSPLQQISSLGPEDMLD